jgi:hypothetical protein
MRIPLTTCWTSHSQLPERERLWNLDVTLAEYEELVESLVIQRDWRKDLQVPKQQTQHDAQQGADSGFVSLVSQYASSGTFTRP